MRKSIPRSSFQPHSMDVYFIISTARLRLARIQLVLIFGTCLSCSLPCHNFVGQHRIGVINAHQFSIFIKRWLLFNRYLYFNVILSNIELSPFFLYILSAHTSSMMACTTSRPALQPWDRLLCNFSMLRGVIDSKNLTIGTYKV